MKLNGLEKSEVKRIIHEKTGYYIKSSIILNQIFRRSSLAAETGENSNEIFEFIGDQVLSFYVVKIITKKFGSISALTNDYSFRIHEGQFTQIKQNFVNNEALAEIIEEWDISKYLLLGKSDIKNEITKELKVKADLFEAIIGAIAIESNWDHHILETAIMLTLNMETKISAMIESDTKARNINIDNAITTLKEMAENKNCTMPKYEFAGPDSIGYDSDGNPKWFCVCRIINDITGLTQLVMASSKKDAKKAAAYLILCEHLCIPNKYGPPVDCHTEWTYKDGKLLPNKYHKQEI